MYGLSESNLKELRSILASIPHIEEAVIYGSRARGDYKYSSDIDLSLKGKELNDSDMALLDDKLYYSYSPYYFDTNLFASLANKDLVENIKRSGKVLYRKGVS